MKTILSLFLMTTLSNITIAQITLIPDTMFEQELINLSIDTGLVNGFVPTSNIDTVTSLNVISRNISDLTGIEDFTALSELYCGYNLISNLDVSQNLSLTKLDCKYNLLTNLDLTTCLNLVVLRCANNQLINLDLTLNTLLRELHCEYNELSILNLPTDVLAYVYCYNNHLQSLDLSSCSSLIHLVCSQNILTNLKVGSGSMLTLDCSQNQLSCLNIKDLNITNFFSFDNPNLNCIEVFNVVSAYSNWSNNIDSQTSFSTNCNNACSVVGITENSLSNLSLYPNPTSSNITIDLEEVNQDIKATLSNGLGQVILTQQFKSTDFINLDIDAPKGIYFLQIETTEGETKTIKVLKE